LINNTGLGTGDQVDLPDTSVSCTDVTTLEGKGVTVNHNCVAAAPGSPSAAVEDPGGEPLYEAMRR
jgi:hypothetical protein